MNDSTVTLHDVSPEQLEAQARERLAQADLDGAAGLLQQAARDWVVLDNAERAGTCWLLAASTLRLAGQLGPAGEAARNAQELGTLPAALRRGVEMELAEQALASGDAALAQRRFGAVLLRHAEHLDGPLRAVVLQRRAAAASAAHDEPSAADDFCAAADLMERGGKTADAEAARLAAAACLSTVDPQRAEALWRQVNQHPPRDGTGAARRGLVGGHIALQGHEPALALARYGAARQGALDARDAASYLAASVQSANLLEQQGQLNDAYARLASAWVTLGSLLGRESAATLVRPALQGLRERLGPEVFQRVKDGYEAARRRVRTAED
ncbi:hypothetical protein [Hydrogenophaga sp. 2FB]|uniref:hypothetical protein n=1 Tax=Hydrogenophaga sp. 2FB TaxID=2502187 RepID=UPI0010F8DEA1|nr:hypothetical protein [Hydrogenophaga sp. 2FB]